MKCDKRQPKILIVKMSSLGDVIHSLPVLKVLRDKWPEAHISWVVNSIYSRILSGHPLLDQVIEFERGKWADVRRLIGTMGEMFRFRSLLKKGEFDLVLDLQGLLKSGLITYLSNAPYRIGFANAREGSSFFYNQKVKLPGKKMHAVDRYLYLTGRVVGLDKLKPEFQLPGFSEKGEFVKKFLTSHKIDKSEALVAVCPSARWQSKQWFPESLEKLIVRLITDKCRVVLVGGKEDKAMADRLASNLPSDRVISLAGQTDLLQLGIILETAKVLVTNDTGPMHLAAAIGTPVVAIFGPTDPELTGPYGEGHTVLTSSMACSPCFKKDCRSRECLSRISVDEVYSAVLAYL